MFGDMRRTEVEAILRDRGVTEEEALKSPCNVTLLRSGGRAVLFDAGAGPDFMSTAGALPDALTALGVDPTEITDVVFTHGHPDHLWGVLDDFDDPYFANARHYMSAVERDYWADPLTATTIGEDRASFAAGALRRLDVLGDRIETFADGAEVVSGVSAVLTPGHTPGHTSFIVSDGEVSIMIVGDAIRNAHVSLAKPDWVEPADQDADLGRATRVALIDRLISDRMPFVGFHLPAGGIGVLERSSDGTVFTPEV